jgi:predicted ATP-grasp superfamily ATP-dependent carboligase/CelD/BcsL family acetyltransferase involved in cellulose biosynthesis
MNDRLPAVILGGSVNAVSVARSLGGAGVTVLALGRPQSPVRFSRFCSEFHAFDGLEVQPAWLEWLERSPREAVLLPCDDEGLELIARNRSRLTALGYRPFEANDDVLLAMLDKQATYELARAAGIEAPWTIEIRGCDAVPGGPEPTFPCAVKPIHSHVFQQRAVKPVKALVVATETELEEALAYVRELDVDAIVTEIIPGGDDQLCSYYSYLDVAGQPLLHLTKRKLRQYPPGFGLGCYHITDHNPEVARLGLAFFQSAGVRGLANVEFKRDARDGRLKLIECNHRFTAANEQLRAAGMDLALFVYSRLAGIPGPDVSRYRAGVRLWYPIQDTRTFLARNRDGDLELSTWLSSLLHRQRFPLFSRSDARPSLAASWWIARRVLGRRLSRTPPARVATPSDRPAVAEHNGRPTLHELGSARSTVVADLEALEPLVPAWRELSTLTGNIFVTPEWFLTWARHYGDDDSHPFVPVVHDGDGGVRGLVPLVLTSSRMKVLRFAGSSLGDYFQPVCGADDVGLVTRLATRELLARSADWNLAVLHNIDPLPGWPGTLLAASRRQLRAVWDDASVLPYAELGGGSFEEYLATRSRNLRSQLGRKLRGLERAHDIRFRLVEDPREVPGAMRLFFDLHDRRWEQKGGSSVAPGRARAFHTDLAVAACEQGWLRLWLLELDGEPAASFYGWSIGGRYSYYLAGFDPVWSRHSVGLLLLAHTVRSAAEEGAHTYDFLLGDEVYKDRFASGERRVRTAMVTRPLHPARGLAMVDVGMRRAGRQLPDNMQEELRLQAARVLDRMPSTRRR